ncbi:MAG: glycosyltransferase [Bacteroides sp.]|nr:glycosyltransferase [Bacteroides sp.]
MILTIDGSENNYSNNLRKEYGGYKSLIFAGLLSPDKIRELYASSDCLLFPSRLETWRLPITEYAPYRKPILTADRPYAHETTAGTSLTGYFNPDNARELAGKMEKLIKGDESGLKTIPFVKPEAPFTQNWEELFHLLLK